MAFSVHMPEVVQDCHGILCAYARSGPGINNCVCILHLSCQVPRHWTHIKADPQLKSLVGASSPPCKAGPRHPQLRVQWVPAHLLAKQGLGTHSSESSGCQLTSLQSRAQAPTAQESSGCQLTSLQSRAQAPTAQSLVGASSPPCKAGPRHPQLKSLVGASSPPCKAGPRHPQLRVQWVPAHLLAKQGLGTHISESSGCQLTSLQSRAQAPTAQSLVGASSPPCKAGPRHPQLRVQWVPAHLLAKQGLGTHSSESSGCQLTSLQSRAQAPTAQSLVGASSPPCKAGPKHPQLRVQWVPAHLLAKQGLGTHSSESSGCQLTSLQSRAQAPTAQSLVGASSPPCKAGPRHPQLRVQWVPAHLLAKQGLGTHSSESSECQFTFSHPSSKSSGCQLISLQNRAQAPINSSHLMVRVRPWQGKVILLI